MPDLTNPTRQKAMRARATPSGMFLQEEAAFEIEDRLQAVNKTFTSVAVVTPFAEVWRRFFPDATIVPDDDRLALTPGAHDLVIHAMSLHWANDPVGQLIQSVRALQPDGFFLGAMLGGDTLVELREVMTRVEVAMTGGLSQRVLPMAEIRDLGALLQRAGFALPVADSARRNVTYRDAKALFHDLRAMGEGNALSSRPGPTPRGFFEEVARDYAASHGQDGRIPASFDLIFLTGWAPHESQQQPLRPGSATTLLADALAHGETKDDTDT